MESGLPVGLFGSQEESWSAAAIPSEPVEPWMSPSFIYAWHTQPLFRVAQRAHATGVEMVVVMDDADVIGTVSSMDIARVASTM